MQIHVQLNKTGWAKRDYSLLQDSGAVATLHYDKAFSQTARAVIGNEELLIRRRGWWKYYLEISSASRKYDMRIGINWRGAMKIVDSAGNPFTFKSTGFWGNKWQWFDRHNRPIVEMKSKSFSKKNRGVIEIRYQEMQDQMFWIVVGWFQVLSSESDAALAAAT